MTELAFMTNAPPLLIASTQRSMFSSWLFFSRFNAASIAGIFIPYFSYFSYFSYLVCVYHTLFSGKSQGLFCSNARFVSMTAIALWGYSFEKEKDRPTPMSSHKGQDNHEPSKDSDDPSNHVSHSLSSC